MAESKEVKKVEYKKAALNAREEITYTATHGSKVKGDKQKVHPNTAILLKHIGVAK